MASSSEKLVLIPKSELLDYDGCLVGFEARSWYGDLWLI